MPEITEVVYSDIPLNLTSHPITGNIKMLSNADAVKQSVKNLVSGRLGERPFQPNIGSQVYNVLFDNLCKYDSLLDK